MMSEEKEFAIGDRVRVIALPPYVKTAAPMPMLRPPNVIHLGEEGTILDRRPGGWWGVRFSGGAFLMDSQYIESVSTQVSHSETSVQTEATTAMDTEAETGMDTENSEDNS